MQITCEDKPQSMAHITLTIPVAEQEPYLQKAAEKISEKLKVSGFRPGHIPYDIVKKEVGEMAIMEQAADAMIKKGLVEAIKEHKLETIGQPDVKVKKLTPGNDIEVDIEWAKLPDTTLPDLSTISVQEKTASVDDKEVENAIEEIRKMRATEAATTNAATKEDRVVVDMEILVDHVTIEGGTTKDHAVYLSEDSYVPGLTDKLVGSKKGEDKNFHLEIPKTHYSKLLAGKNAEFKIKVKDVFERTLPEVNIEFAKALGAESVDDLKKLLKENLLRDKQAKETERATGEMIDTILEKSTFGEIPGILIESEKERLFGEFKQRLTDQGVSVEKYLADVKKTPEELAEGFSEQAEKRVKGSLVFRDLATAENIEVSEQEIKAEMEAVKQSYQDNPNIDEKLKDPNIVDFITVNLRNRKTTEKLRAKLVQKAQVTGKTK